MKVLCICGQLITMPCLSGRPTNVIEVWRVGFQCCWSCSLKHPSHRHLDHQQHPIFQEETQDFCKFYDISVY